MKKKEYMIPTCEVVELETVSMIAGSVTETPGTGDDFELESNRHRGEWGNLWN
jgi:hypothetical protein